jgi:hypothetical protein
VVYVYVYPNVHVRMHVCLHVCVNVSGGVKSATWSSLFEPTFSASEQCRKRKRKTISSDDVINVLEDTDFGSIADSLVDAVEGEKPQQEVLTNSDSLNTRLSAPLFPAYRMQKQRKKHKKKEKDLLAESVKPHQQDAVPTVEGSKEVVGMTPL